MNMLKRNLGPRLAAIFNLVVILFVFATLMRVLFFFAFRSDEIGDEIKSISEILLAFYIGAKFDIRVIFVLVLPLLVLSWLKPFDFTRSKRASQLWRTLYTFIVFALAGVYIIDFGYYDYLQTRVNATALKFLMNPMISISMVWQSYPVVPTLIAGLAFAIGLYFALRFVGFTSTSQPTFRRRYKVFLFIVSFLLITSGLYGKLSFYPLRWSEAFFSTNLFVSYTAVNPLHYFIDTLKIKEADYDKQSTQKYYSVTSNYLGVTDPDFETLKFSRDLRLTPLPTVDPHQPPNIVIIMMESFAGYKTGALGHPLQPTPQFDQLAKNGVLFTQFYTPSEATARGMFTILTGIPDVSKGRTSSRNPLIVSQNTVANAFEEYEKYYFIGGSANWGNIRGVYSASVPEIHIIEENMYESPRVDVWGISDLSLFREVHKKISQRKEANKPFFAIIQTAGFHRPYTIPEDHGDFKLSSLSDEEVKKYGFVSKAEYDSLRFSDYALGEFFELAQQKKYYENTIYVILGDHGLPTNQASHLPAGIKRFELERFHTPLLFYSPRHLQSQKIDTIATQPDVLPTLAGLVGKPFKNTTLGRNLFADEFNDRRYAFHYIYYMNPPGIGVIDGEYLLSARADGTIFGLYKYLDKDPGIDVRDQYPEIFNKLKDLTFGLYETSKYILYHNKNSAMAGTTAPKPTKSK